MNAKTAENAWSRRSIRIVTSANALIDTTVEVAKSCVLFRTVGSIQAPENDL